MCDKSSARNVREHACEVAIIGSGVAGLAAAKYLLAECDSRGRGYFEVTLYERFSKAGGIWNQTTTSDRYATPMYNACTTNVPHYLMNFHDQSYPSNTPLFPSNTVVQDYLTRYAQELEDEGVIKYNHEVVDITPLIFNYEKKWKITFAGVPANNYIEPTYWDAVIVATGSFSKPSIPTLFNNIRNIQVLHSKDFRNSRDFCNKKVVVVGGGPSYWDIARLVSEVSKGAVIVSVRSPLEQQSSSNQKIKGVIQNVAGNTVFFADGSFEQRVDVIILCTGYKYDFPFLPCIEVTDDGRRVEGLHDHMLWKENPSLAFVGLPSLTATFIVAEAQSAFIAGVFSGRISLPSTPYMNRELQLEIRAWRKKDHELGVRTGFHQLRYPLDLVYVNYLHAKGIEARRLADGTGSQSYLLPVYHGNELLWLRECIGNGQIRTLYNRKVAQGEYPSTVEELGFRYPGVKQFWWL